MPQRRHASPERAVQVAIVRWLRLVLPADVDVAAVDNESRASSDDDYSRARYYAARKAGGVLDGYEDLIIDLPLWLIRQLDKAGARLEVKRPGGVVSEAQQQMHARHIANGYLVGVVDSIEAARWFMVQWGIPLAEAPGQPVAVARVRYAKRRDPLNQAVPF